MPTQRRNKVIVFYPDSVPKGRLYVENMTPVSALCAVRLLDRKRYDIHIITRFFTGEDYVEEILEHCQNALLFGVSAFIGYQILEGLRVSKAVKEKFPDLPVVWGGWFPSSDPEMTIKHPAVDVVVRKQGEITLAELANAYDKGLALEGIRGISHKDGQDRIIHNEDRPFTDINEFPRIPYDLLKGANLVYNMDGYKTIDYMSSYGCPHRCAFCCEPAVNNGRWSGLSPQRMVADLEYLQKAFGVEAVTLLDTNTFTSARRIREFCKLYLQKGLTVKFTMTCGKISHLMKFDDELWRLIKQANMNRIQIGLESGKQEYLKLLHKDHRLEDVFTILDRAKAHGISLFISTMIGIPTASIDEEFSAAMDLVNRILEISDQNKYAMFLYTPLPATALLPLAVKEGFVAPRTLEEWGSFDYNDPATPWVGPSYPGIVKQIQFYFKYFLVKDLIYQTPSPKLRFGYRFLYAFANPLARWRFRKRCFSFPIDYYLLSMIVNTGKHIQALADRRSRGRRGGPAMTMKGKRR
jgi:radical SAM superfamily enzyme YgiQ (UPF0313 family)